MKYCGLYKLPEDWDSAFDMRMLLAQTDGTLRKAYICSPCRASTPEGVYANMLAARYYMYYTYKHMEVCPCAPHAILPAILNDRSLYERKLALSFGKELLNITSEMFVCGQILTAGMRGEILKAVELSIPIKVFSPGLYNEVQQITSSILVQYDDNHVPLVFNAGELFAF
jgi:hypothetical protein